MKVHRLTAEYEVDVLGLVDFSSNDSFIASAQGTYEITFFGTSPGNATAVVVYYVVLLEDKQMFLSQLM